MTPLELNGVSGYTQRAWNGISVVDVSTEKATYRGREYRQLDNFERRKLENLIIINGGKHFTRVVYDGERRAIGNPR